MVKKDNGFFMWLNINKDLKAICFGVFLIKIKCLFIIVSGHLAVSRNTNSD